MRVKRKESNGEKMHVRRKNRGWREMRKQPAGTLKVRRAKGRRWRTGGVKNERWRGLQLSLSLGFSVHGCEEGIWAELPVFELSAAEAAGRPGRRCDTIISAWRMAAGGRERQYPLHHHPSAALPEGSSLGATYSPGHLSSAAKICLAPLLWHTGRPVGKATQKAIVS